jgi:hypothetical protein
VKIKTFPPILCLLAFYLAALACAGGASSRTFNHAEFRFDYPSNWQTMAELWGTYELQKDYYGLGAKELAALTSVRKKGESGVWFSVAARPLMGVALSELGESLYAQAVPAVAELQQSTTALAGQPAITFRYRRPWGEAWWEFYDLWVDKNGFAYLLSFHAYSLEGHQAEIDLILKSFSFQP